MMQATKQAPKTEELLENISSFYADYLGYKPKNTDLINVEESGWENFTQQRGLNPESSGVYLPRNQTAVIKDGNPLSLFHEYFGHGLYCEQSLAGRQLVDLERRLLEEERLEFENRKFTLEDLRRFRQQTPTFQELNELRQKDLSLYEGFAVWSEYFLSGKFGHERDFERKYDGLSESDQKGLQEIVNFSKQLGPLATFYAFGMARRTTPERARMLLEEIYGKKALEDSKLILLTGSRGHFSDIDLFASSNSIKPEVNEWLDLVVFREDDFEKRVHLFEVQVTHPIMAGELVFGDSNYLKKLKTQLMEQPITREAIKHNLDFSKEQRRFGVEGFPKEKRRISEGYALSAQLLANALEEGKRLLTLDSLGFSYKFGLEDRKLLRENK
jgi:hypothetical protein